MQLDVDETKSKPKKSFISRMAEALNSVFKKNKRKKLEGFSRFVHFLIGLDKDTDLYKQAHAAVTLCDEAMDVISQRMMLIGKLKNTGEKLAELEAYNNLTLEEAKHLKNLLERYSSLVKDKNALKYQVTGFDKAVALMADVEDDAPLMLGEIQDAEDKQRIFKQDIGFLQGEKSELEYERENISFAIDFIYKFTIGIVVVFALAMVGLSMLYVFNGTNILFPASVLFVVVVVMTVLLYSLRKRLKYELQLNFKKQSRAVELINKKSVVYVHYTNFLNYEYKKFRVRNSEMLKENLKEYKHYKHLAKRFDSVRSIMHQTEEEIEKFLRAKNISTMSMTLGHFAKAVDIEDKKLYHSELLEEKAVIERNLLSIDARQEKIWEELTALNESDTSEERLIDTIVKTYLDEAGKILARFEPLKTEPAEQSGEPVEAVSAG